MSDSKSSSSGGIGFCGLLAIVFIVLKLTGFIDWSWFWVLCPLWAGFALIGLIILLGVIAAGFITYKNSKKKNTRRW